MLGTRRDAQSTETREYGQQTHQERETGARAAGPAIGHLTSRGGRGLMVWKVVMKYRREMEVDLQRKSQK